MQNTSMNVPVEGIKLDKTSHLFLVDLGGPFGTPLEAERRAFVDLSAAVRFIDGRLAKLSAFMSPLGISADAAVYGLVEEAFESTVSKTYILRFANAPSMVLKCHSSNHDGEFEPFKRIYPVTTANA